MGKYGEMTVLIFSLENDILEKDIDAILKKDEKVSDKSWG